MTWGDITGGILRLTEAEARFQGIRIQDQRCQRLPCCQGQDGAAAARAPLGADWQQFCRKSLNSNLRKAGSSPYSHRHGNRTKEPGKSGLKRAKESRLGEGRGVSAELGALSSDGGKGNPVAVSGKKHPSPPDAWDGACPSLSEPHNSHWGRADGHQAPKH